ncbi:lysylphosphatidylglycerol synthase domain-containing protein [Beijerinckia indica]|uniref:Integral membrane protein-like protein n=1 Tax=Beijerinckia indica subsp. indica (strain ATCC 9039 / DSM 1715 / NCIMB 8712) TaxID=395963 RepID=B2ICY9_BEII9|nr:lysylphosphatidylglycerol synthase domain-containing protein [Beijerinckia indica]ACB96754.1 integral membrane protein-like protein [Beijerinckia indica subsp. indica ATCC 9039]
MRTHKTQRPLPVQNPLSDPSVKSNPEEAIEAGAARKSRGLDLHQDHAVDEATLPETRTSLQKFGHWLAIAFSVLLAGFSVYVLVHTLTGVSLSDLRAAIAAKSAEQITAAAFLTSLSYLALTGYDALALRQLNLHVPYKTTALASFTSYAISFTLGFPLITAGTVRYWIYSQAGLGPGRVASLTVIAGITFWLGMVLVIGLALFFRSTEIGQINHLSGQLNLLIGLAILATFITYLVWVSLRRRQVRLQGFRLELPGFRLTVAQVILGVCDLCAASGVLYSLLPDHRIVDFFTFAGTYVFACILGIASNAPGGIGVFEATLLNAIPATSQEALLASLLLFRIIYYLVPFVLALAFLGAHESFRRWKSLREAMSTSQDAKLDPDPVINRKRDRS